MEKLFYIIVTILFFLPSWGEKNVYAQIIPPDLSPRDIDTVAISIDTINIIINSNIEKYKKFFLEVGEKEIYIAQQKEQLLMLMNLISSVKEFNIEYIEKIRFSANNYLNISTNREKISKIKEYNEMFDEIIKYKEKADKYKDVGYVYRFEFQGLLPQKTHGAPMSTPNTDYFVSNLEKDDESDIEKITDVSLERLIELCEGKGIEYDEDRVGTDGTILSLLQAVKYLVSLLNAVDNSNDDITRTDASRAIKRIITIDGRIVTKPVHGFVIIQTTDGRAKKVIMK